MRPLRSVKSAPSSLRRAFLHTSAPKPNPSNLLNNASQYTGLSVQALKSECKRKGLKVTGRKAELIDRLASFDVKSFSSPRTMSSTARVLAKGDSSTIDFYSFPLETFDKEEPPLPFKIPVPPDTSAPVRAVDPQYATPVPDGGAASGDLSGTHQSAKVHVIGESPVRTLNDDAVANHEEEPFNEDLSSRDKSVLTALAGAVAGWWLLGNIGKKKNRSDSP
jgi:hypothetical protein